jgi:cation:H+ antiporter|tara:strand:+ start:123 stop:1064 length:942 start_codon:yes stop_codon:yes gene_type:complete
MSIALIIVGFILLVIGGEFLVRSSVALSFKLNLSKLVIGMTVVSFATSAPELLVSLNAALDGSPDLALGNVVGSNIANIALVLGLTAIISPIVVDKNFYKMNWPAMMIISLLFYYFLINDNVISQFEGIYLLGFLVVFVYIMISKARKDKVLEVDDVDDTLQDVSYFKIFFWLLIGGSALYFGSSWLVDGAKDIAINLGISEGVIGATVIAVGTSIPELSASIIAALKGEKAISLGNLIGSNIFNIGSVIGLTAIITPIKAIEPNVITNVYWMLGVAAILIPLVFIPKKFEINRVKGLLLLSIYIIFIYLAFQ